MFEMGKVLLSQKEPDNPWFSHLLGSLGPRGERMYPGEPQVWHPPTDVYETDLHVIVKMEIAGVGEDDLVVQLHGRQLNVRGCRYDPAEKLAYQQMEISYGEFRSDVQLPYDVDPSRATAGYGDGFLYIHLPKAHKEHRVPVVVVIQRQ